MKPISDSLKDDVIAFSSHSSAQDHQTRNGHNSSDLEWDDIVTTDVLGLELDSKLICLTDVSQGGVLSAYIKRIRQKLSQNLGFLLRPFVIRQNLKLLPNHYRILINGVVLGEGVIYPELLMALNQQQPSMELAGIKAQEPIFGQTAYWVQPDEKLKVEKIGFTTMNPHAVISTHISYLLQNNAAKILGHDELQQLLDRLAIDSPQLVKVLNQGEIALNQVVVILRNLLYESVSISDFKTIIETLVLNFECGQNSEFLTSKTRIALGAHIMQRINGVSNEIRVITLEPAFEHELNQIVENSEVGAFLSPETAEYLYLGILDKVRNLEKNGHPGVLLVSAPIRQILVNFLKPTIPSIYVFAYNEIPDDIHIIITSTIVRK